MKNLILVFALFMVGLANGYSQKSVGSAIPVDVSTPPNFPECTCKQNSMVVEITKPGSGGITVTNGGVFNYTTGPLTVNANFGCNPPTPASSNFACCSALAWQVLNSAGNPVNAWQYLSGSSHSITIPATLIPCQGAPYTLVLQSKCGCNSMCQPWRAILKCCTIPEDKCCPTFFIGTTQTSAGLYSVTANPATGCPTIGAEHYWGLVPSDCPAGSTPTHIPLGNIVSGSTFGLTVSATGVVTPLGMGTGINASTSGYGYNYGGLGVGQCYKLSHYIKCCNQWFVQTKCFCLVSTAKMNLTEKDLNVQSTEMEPVEEKDVPRALRN